MNIIILKYTLCVDLRGFGLSPLLLFVVSVSAVTQVTKPVHKLNGSFSLYAKYEQCF